MCPFIHPNDPITDAQLDFFYALEGARNGLTAVVGDIEPDAPLRTLLSNKQTENDTVKGDSDDEQGGTEDQDGDQRMPDMDETHQTTGALAISTVCIHRLDRQRPPAVLWTDLSALLQRVPLLRHFWGWVK